MHISDSLSLVVAAVAVAARSRQAEVVVAPFRLAAGEEVHQNRVGAEVHQPTLRRVCFVAVVSVQVAVLVVLPVAALHLQQVLRGREAVPRARSQRTSDR